MHLPFLLSNSSFSLQRLIHAVDACNARAFFFFFIIVLQQGVSCLTFLSPCNFRSMQSMLVLHAFFIILVHQQGETIELNFFITILDNSVKKGL